MFKWIKNKIMGEEKKEDEVLEKKEELEEKIGAEDGPISDSSKETLTNSHREVTGEKNIQNTEDIKEVEDISIEDEKAKVEKTKVEKPEKEEKKKISFFERLKEGLTKTRDNFTKQIDNILKSYTKIDDELFDELEEILITADVGIETTMTLIDNLRDRVKQEKVKDPNEVMGLLKDEIETLMLSKVNDNSFNIEPSPAVVLVVGVNGVGKTTTIGKMANRYKNEGKSVLIAAGDTFRAAAIEQLEEWGNRSGVDIISHSEGSDPAAVIYDAIQAAKARKTDLLICDTAGRLHNKENLMNELNKIFRVVEKEYGEATKEVLLVLDATTGQNAMSQAKTFKEVSKITGIALTKLDGTAKGGVVIALQSELGVPIKFVGVGEGIDDLQPFKSKEFIDAIFEE